MGNAFALFYILFSRFGSDFFYLLNFFHFTSLLNIILDSSLYFGKEKIALKDNIIGTWKVRKANSIWNRLAFNGLVVKCSERFVVAQCKETNNGLQGLIYEICFYVANCE